MIDAITEQGDIAEAKLQLDIARRAGPAAVTAWVDRWADSVIAGLEELEGYKAQVEDGEPW